MHLLLGLKTLDLLFLLYFSTNFRDRMDVTSSGGLLRSVFKLIKLGRSILQFEFVLAFIGKHHTVKVVLI